MKIRRLNEEGIRLFEEFLDSLTTDAPLSVPEWIKDDPETSEHVVQEIEIEQIDPKNRLEMAQYLYYKLDDSGIADIERDRGIWAWLSLFYFELLCPADDEGMRKPGERARWIPVIGNFRKYYRHLLLGPYGIYRAHRDNPERALALLSTPPHQPGDIAEQLASRQELVTNPAIVEAATILYIDQATKLPKRGAAGRGAGSARRLSDVLNQFDVTWSLYSMDTKDILSMLPEEFDRFGP